MSESIVIVDKQDYLLAVYVGEYNIADARVTIDQILRSIHQNGSRTVLLDCRQMTGQLSIWDRYQTAIYGQKMIGKVAKMALVRSQERAGADRFLENVAVNRGINLRLFSDYDEALAWLKS